MKPLLLLLAIFFSTYSFSEKRVEFGAHEHGIAELEIAAAKNVLLLDFKSPAMNISGFEYVPQTTEDFLRIDEKLRMISNPESLVQIPTNALCSLMGMRVVLEQMDDHKDQDDDHKDHDDDHKDHDDDHKDHDDDHKDHDDHRMDQASHSEFQASFTFNCRMPEKLNPISIVMFDKFPATEKVRVEWVKDGRAGVTETVTSSRLVVFDK